MKAGPLRERVRLESRMVTRDSIGGEVFTWRDQGTVWASVEAITGREAAIAEQIEAIITLRVICRRRDDIAATWRVLWKNRILSIEAVLPHPQRDRITLLCSEGVNKADL